MALNTPTTRQMTDETGRLSEYFQKWLVDLVMKVNKSPNTSAAGVYTIASGVITPRNASFSILPESGSTDNLDTINATYYHTGDVISIWANDTTKTIVVKHNVGNIKTSTGSDVTLDTNEKWLHLLYNGTTWLAGTIV